jgi:hypothetical protein
MNNKTEQTAVDWLEKAFYTYAESTGINSNKWLIDEEDLDKLIKQAKAMHKEEIITTWHKGYDNLSPMIDENNCGDKYYNETYGGNK